MLLKKQTVWLLTMLSLVVVLSVYYITSPNQQGTDLAVDEKKKEEIQTQSKEKNKTGNVEVITETAGDEAFEVLRLELQDERNKLREDLTEKVASKDLSAKEKNKAYEQMETLTEMATKENVLETLIKSKGYKDALVRADGESVRITVKAEKHSPSEANEIIRLVENEIGEYQPLYVEFQPTK
ncbi:stage III sporulation protein AH [Oikeobacillus pervagus]|uniref:Stage III sporulation protein AH n=1 Tax=Oikeobacillus pervagus TaxID=1325931 RepID=A0AAJ1SWE5_9BACI|nr:SpoIIIAH-like family protein [Oikeobacillus pervagus]MDQ0213829.1 stage III sporulation protein AH [Oikeobacillus pervagus]